jgi:hypothetical protein
MTTGQAVRSSLLVVMAAVALVGCGGSNGGTGSGNSSLGAQAAGTAAGEALVQNFHPKYPNAAALADDFKCWIAASCERLPGEPRTRLSTSARHAAAAVVLRDTSLLQRILKAGGVPANVKTVPEVAAFLRQQGVQ